MGIEVTIQPASRRIDYTPHAVVLAWFRDVLETLTPHNIGFALWNFIHHPIPSPIFRYPVSLRNRVSGNRNIMPTRTTPFIPEHYYPIYNRGVNRQPIFLGEDNRLFFIKRLREYSSYRDTIGMRNGTLAHPQIILEQFCSVKEYQKFVEEGRDGNIDKIVHLTLEAVVLQI